MVKNTLIKTPHLYMGLIKSILNMLAVPPANSLTPLFEPLKTQKRLHPDLSGCVDFRFLNACRNLWGSTNNLHAAFGLETLWSSTSHETDREVDEEEEVDEQRVK